MMKNYVLVEPVRPIQGLRLALRSSGRMTVSSRYIRNLPPADKAPLQREFPPLARGNCQIKSRLVHFNVYNPIWGNLRLPLL